MTLPAKTLPAITPPQIASMAGIAAVSREQAMGAPDLPQAERVIIEMTNAFRAENQRAAVKPNATLAKAASAFADYLARTNQFGHTVDGRQPVDRTRAQGYKDCIVAENLALNQDSRGFEARGLAAQAVAGWKASPPHRAAMLHEHVTEIGIGIAASRDTVPKYLSVQLFGRPDALQYTFRVENLSGGDVGYQFDTERTTLARNTVITQTACTPAAVAFDGVQAAYTAADGVLYRLSRGASGRLQVDVSGIPLVPAPR
jgi:uncharacterized protein YkwD